MASDQDCLYTHLTGFIFKDLNNKHWKIGNNIGRGGCAEVYLASEDITMEVPEDSPYVIKLTNGFNNLTLDREYYFYSNVWKSGFMVEENGVTKFGIPKCYGSGSFTDDDDVLFDYIILERLNRNLISYFRDDFSYSAVYEACIKILSILELIHKMDFVHRDLKAENILLDAKNNFHIIDFGLTWKYISGKEKLHVVYEERDYLANAGTLNYISRDSHLGVISRRSDIEMLAFNMIEWTGGILPWNHLVSEDEVEHPKENVKKMLEIKVNMMKNVTKFINICYVKEIPPGMMNFISSIGWLKYDECPNYELLKNILKMGMREM